MRMTDDELGRWLAVRAGKLTASRMGDAMARLKGGGDAKARADYLRDLLAERLADGSIRHYVSPAMQHGIDYEDEAKRAYETATGDLIDDPRDYAEHGFFHHPRIGAFGASPDGLLGKHGLIEVKCPTTTTFVKWVMAGTVPDEHKPQMLAQLACTGRKWCEFVAYDPRVKDEARRLFVRRYEPVTDEIASVEKEAAAFVEELERAWEALTEAAA